MFAGHVGVALALGRVERHVNLGVFVVAALLPDLVLWTFVLLGWESVAIPADFARTHQPAFVFPYSHGLLAAIAWSLLAGASIAAVVQPLPGVRLRAASLVGIAVFSHWLLDALVHVPELPVAGATSTMFGLGLWNTMPAALAIEAVVTLAGLWWFVSSARLSRGRSVALALLVCVTLVFTVLGMTVAPPPPSALAMAWSSLVAIAVVGALAGWLGPAVRRV